MNYVIITNIIDGFSPLPSRCEVTEVELRAFLVNELPFLWNSSTGEWDFAVYRNDPQLVLRRKYSYYVIGAARFRVIELSYIDGLIRANPNGPAVEIKDRIVTIRTDINLKGLVFPLDAPEKKARKTPLR